jgi:hypothetical protein
VDDATNNKYRWAKGTKSSHLPSGELPITVCRPTDDKLHSTIGISEGILKPFVAANRLGQIFIGAAGGNFQSSPKQTKESLEVLAKELNTNIVDIYPDAGDVLNSHTMRRIERNYKLFSDWGYEVRIAWWGQVNKDKDSDIDELDNLASVNYLSFEAFLKIAEKARILEEKVKQKEAEEAIYKELTQLTQKPWKEINKPKLDLEKLNLEPGAIYIVCSAKGTHKTNSLVPIVPKFNNVFAWFNRIALGREECSRIGLDWKDTLGSWAGTMKVGFCAESAHQFNPSILRKNPSMLLADEADQVFAQMFGSTCNKDGKRPLILTALKAQLHAAVAGGGIGLFMSADITDKEVEYIKQLAPKNCPVKLIVNHYKPQLGDVYFYSSDTPDGLVEKLLQALESNIPCFVIDDIKDGIRGCKSLTEYIRKVHPEWAPEIVEINSETSGSSEIINYLENINTASQTTRLLCCSPSVVSGISIQNQHFKKVFGFFNGVLTVSNASQSLARVRGADEINVWAAEKGLIWAANHSLSPEEIKDYFLRNYQENCKHILSFGVEYQPLEDEWNSPHFELYCKYAAYRNCCMARLRERLRDRLIEEGYQVHDIVCSDSDMVKEGLKESWADLELKKAHAVANAKILSDKELFQLADKRPTPEEQLDSEKTFLIKSFGQELIDATTYEHKSGEVLTGFAAMYLKNKNGDYKKKLDNFHLLVSDEKEALTKDLQMEDKQLENGDRFAGDIRWNLRKLKCMKYLGLDAFLHPGEWWEPLDLAKLCNKAKKHPSQLKDALGFSIEKMYNGQIFGELMGQLGLELDKKWATTQTKDGKRFKLRSINRKSWEDAQMYVKHRQAVAEKGETQQATSPAQEPTVTVRNSDHPPVSILNEVIGGGDQNQNCHAEPAITTDTPSVAEQEKPPELLRLDCEGSKYHGSICAVLESFADEIKVRVEGVAYALFFPSQWLVPTR